MDLFKLSLIISIAGIFLLLFLSNILEPKIININEINEKMLNQKVKISGSIFRIESKEDFQIISIVDETGKIEVLCECDSNLQENQNIEVIGRVQEYEKYLQIQADKIIKK